MKKTAINVITTIIIAVALLAMIEGMIGWAAALWSVVKPQVGYTAYDVDLGWKTIPDTYLPHFFGEGKHVRINARGFRNDKEISETTAAGMQRIICSGDSFTFGEGVANDKVWCELLGATSRNIETVNMGVPGYGVDQAYLWYRSGGNKIEHNIHIFAFIGADFERMTMSRFHGRGKPILRLNGNTLVTENVPVPKLSMTVTRIGAQLKTIKLANRLLNYVIKPTENDSEEKVVALMPTVAAVFQEIVNLNAKEGSMPIFVYLPVQSEIAEEGFWRPHVSKLVSQMGLNFIDLTDALKALPGSQSNAFFIQRNRPGKGHYSESGNLWVAEQLKHYLEAMPQS